MSEQKTTREEFQALAAGLSHIAMHIDGLLSSIKRDEAELKKLDSIIDELRDENERLKREAKGGEA